MNRHRRELTDEEQGWQQAEETAYRAWCAAHGLDPDDTESAVAYEGTDIFDDEQEDHR